MKVYDCFIFNNELDMLELRLEYMNASVDYFVIVESARTLSNSVKPLTFDLNKQRFNKFESKIIHVIADSNDLPAWEYEYFQRDSIRRGLAQCEDDDIVFVSDVDEIINVNEILSRKLQPARIEISMYYYYFNLKTDIPWRFNLVGPASVIKTTNIGDRTTYQQLFPELIGNEANKNGWHFSYLFGRDVSLYVAKVKSFSHQEFNTPYYLNEGRIATCINYGLDLFERAVRLRVDNSPLGFLGAQIDRLNMNEFVYDPTQRKEAGMTARLWWIRMKVLNRIRNAVRNRIRL